ncbi:hypothetical protein SAMN04488498_12957 [Mesorhizobium albiziae]|uniref:Uncharacterized protein n=1 Tax=Neomesorhizobium albiziae TaxID=335020 RepID=A0A1I4EUE4_9HYPH|nr:hypothetical protein [Mesorhizobium albiziae]GLS30820.1 hypothetical protein GCM10007937_25280 [Mesorhizobium albiziae]SFL08147.1 hypothetical protein SAMN04488498_12957 [Mesorhizobium albiziae]
MPMLSDYPGDKILVGCIRCGMRRQYDKAAMLKAGDDRTLAMLLDEIVRRSGCVKVDNVNIYDRCGAKYEDLLELLKAARRHR